MGPPPSSSRSPDQRRDVGGGGLRDGGDLHRRIVAERVLEEGEVLVAEPELADAVESPDEDLVSCPVPASVT